MTPPRIVPYASIFKWLAQVWSLAGWILKCCSDGLWLLILGVGACLPTLLFLYQPGWWYRIQGQQPVSHSILTLLWKGTLLQELILETRVMPPFHCCSYSSLCPFPGSVRTRQDCSSASALSKRKHIADNYSVTKYSRLFWLITVFVSPLSTCKCKQKKSYNFFENEGKKKLKYGITETWRLPTKWDTLYNCAEKAALKITMIIPASDPVPGWLF